VKKKIKVIRKKEWKEKEIKETYKESEMNNKKYVKHKIKK
jgi:hypothetical protein